ncbi:MAG: Na+/H+ antiporter NhaA [Gammaproteobacteria bacterium]|jgi:NhaA family Na+:H+ antiporter
MNFINNIKWFLKLESSSGLILLAAALIGILLNNSPLTALYDALLEVPVTISIGKFELAKPLLLWINDGLMAVFFFLIGLEVKREFLAGEFSSPTQIALPALAAMGGMAFPALIYAYINWGDSVAINGWAIPAATDIAFALAVLTLLGNRVPPALKLFLLSLAIIDDLGAIIIIAIFYTVNISQISLIVASVCIVILIAMNRWGVKNSQAYFIVGMIMWVSVLKSGVHATLAGVVLALIIPASYGNDAPPEKKLERLNNLEHSLHPWVAFLVLPLFAFANAGISLAGFTAERLFDPIPLGIAAGLFFGNQIGIMLFSWLTITLGIAKLPKDVTWLQLYGTAIICGVGFTMSLFIGSLAFEHVQVDYTIDDRLGIITGSLLSAVVGYMVLKFALKKTEI